MSVRWGILGCGDVCEVKSGPAFQKVPGSELVAVMRRNRALAEDYARRHAVPAFYDDADRLIADPRVDAVYIATPPGSHLELALKVAASGKPAYVEKPMARTHAECERMLEAFDKALVPLFVAYYRRALDRFLKAKELSDSGALGVVSTVTYRFASGGQRLLDPAHLPWRAQPEHAGAGLFLDLASHTLDIFDFLFGPLSGVSGHASNRTSPGPAEDTVVLTFRTASGALGSASWSFASELADDMIVVSGSKGELRLSTFGKEPVEVRSARGVEFFDLPNPLHIQEPLIYTVVNALLEQKPEACASTGVSAARTSRVMDDALTSYYGSREDGFWLRPEHWPGLKRRGA